MRLGEFMAGLVMLGAGWLALTRAILAAHEGELTTLLRVPLAPAYYVFAALLAAGALAHLDPALMPRTHAGEALR